MRIMSVFQERRVEVFRRRERVRISRIIEDEVGDLDPRKPAGFVDPECDEEGDICVPFPPLLSPRRLAVWVTVASSL